MSWDLARALHVLHSVDVLVSFKAANGNLLASLVPFIMKFALFVCMNSFRVLLNPSLPTVSVDSLVMQDFVFLYFIASVAWNTPTFSRIANFFKGSREFSNRWIVALIRSIYYSAFTWFRIQAGTKAVSMFQENQCAVLVMLVLFLEFNGWLLAFCKRDFSRVFSSLPRSLLVSSIVAADPALVILIAPLLMYRHLITPVWKSFS